MVRSYARARRKFPRRRDSRFRAWIGLAALLILPAAMALSGPAALGGEAALRVVDGDTVEVRATGERIRLLGIDAPESGDRARCRAERVAASRATAGLRAALRDKPVEIRRSGEDRYGRTLAVVMVENRNVSDVLLEAGLVRRWSGRRTAWCAPDGALVGL